jgi:hypothetical protein
MLKNKKRKDSHFIARAFLQKMNWNKENFPWKKTDEKFS